MTMQLTRLGLRCFTVDGDEEHNSVTVTVPNPELVRQAVAEGRVTAPAKLRLLQGGYPQWR